MKDDSFRKQLLENPGAAVEAETGMKIPPTMKIIVLQESSQTVYLKLPPFPLQNTELELSESELEKVAGGFDIWSNDSVCLSYCDRCLR